MSPDDPWEPSGGPGRSRSPGGPTDAGADSRPQGAAGRLRRSLRGTPLRGRRVRRTVRHVEPWSVLKISLLFFSALFLIVCVASGLLWSGARASGQLDNVESFITSVGGFGNCEPIDPGRVAEAPTTTVDASAADANQIDPSLDTTDATTDTSEPRSPTTTTPVDDSEDCPVGDKLVGQFKFDDSRIFEAFAFGGVVLVLAGTGANVVLVLLFNLMSDLTGGVQVTVVEEDPNARRRTDPGSPPSHRRG
jgi:hypothetical protein